MGQNVKLQGMSKGMMPLDSFRRIWEKSFRRYRGEIGLYNWGESFLNPDLPGMVAHAKKNSAVRLVLNSNFSFSFDDRIVEILKYLEDDSIIISCDGFSQEICEKYRINVDFGLVMHNIELINRHKKPQTKLTWQYLKFPWNSAEEKAAENYCKEKRIEFFLGKGGIISGYPVLPAPRGAKINQFRCNFYLNSLSINFDGEVYPCCTYYGPSKYSLGNAIKNSVEKIFSCGKGKEMLDYLTYKSEGSCDIFCKHCVERNAGEVESWKRTHAAAAA